MSGFRGRRPARAAVACLVGLACSAIGGAAPASGTDAAGAGPAPCVHPERAGTTPDANLLSPAAAAAAEQDFRTRLAASPAVSHAATAAASPQARSVTVIPVYWNVIYADRSYEGGDIPAGMVHRQITVLNQGFENTGFQFALVGLRRVHNAEWFETVDPDVPQTQIEMKRQLRDPASGPATMNVYSVALNHLQRPGLLGRGTFPKDYSADPTYDGMLINFRTLPGGTTPDHELGRALIHQTGHWAGLYDTFQGGCSSPGDSVDDTAPEAYASAGCPVGRDSCPEPGEDPIHNFMDSSSDACVHQFSPGQIQRMREQMAVYRGVSS